MSEPKAIDPRENVVALTNALNEAPFGTPPFAVRGPL